MSTFIPGRRDVAVKLVALAVAGGHKPSSVRATTTEGFDVPDDVALAYQNRSAQQRRRKDAVVDVDRQGGR